MNHEEKLEADFETVRLRLAEAEETLSAIRAGEVDGLVINAGDRPELYTLSGADRPYRRLFEVMTEGAAILIADGTVLYCNARLSELLGVPLESVIGGAFQPYIPARHATPFAHLLAETSQARQRLEIELQAADGTLVPVLLSTSSMQDHDVPGICMIATDLTEQKRNAETIAAEERLRLAIGAGELGTWEVDIGARRALGSERMASMVGRRPGETTGTVLEWRVHVHPEDRARVFEAFTKAVKDGSELEVECRTLWLDGSVHWLSVKGTILRDASGTPVRAIGIAFDVTARKKAEAEREGILDRERVAREQAEEANRLKDEFLATVSHELRTPLNAILGWSKLLKIGTLDQGRRAHAVSTIERNALIQTQLIEDLLDVSRIITGKLRLEFVAVDLSGPIHAALDAVRPASEAKSIQIVSVLDPSVGTISGDPDRLQQVVWNLLSNAIKFTPRNGFVTVRLERVESRARLTISDSGEGIGAEFLPHVFERFRQADSTTTRIHSGLGLGLAIVRHLVELHGGAVRAESAGPGQGATFIVTFPIPSVNAKLTQSGRFPLAKSTLGEGVRLDGVSVLLVDDEPDARELIAAVLQPLGAQVKSVASVPEALQFLEKSWPSILLSDIGMPEEDGYSLIRKVRVLEATTRRKLPALALTAYARAEDRRKALHAGFQSHVAKPVAPEELLALVSELVGRTRPAC